MSERFRIAVIGTGRIAQTYLAALKTIPAIELVGVADTRLDLARAASEATGARAYASHEELLQKEKLDAALVTVPPVFHADVTKDCLRAGLNVLCEKPIATKTQDVLSMYAEAERAKRLLMMASKFRYTEDVVAARSMIQAGTIGAPVHCENTFATWLDVKSRWNSDPRISGGGVLMDNGAHSVDIARFLFGPIVEVMAYPGRQVQQIPVEDTAHLAYRCASGTGGTIDVSWSIHKDRAAYVEIFGTEGMLQIGWKSSSFRRNQAVDWTRFGSGYDKQRAFEAQLRNFVGACIGLEPPRIAKDEAIASVRVIEAAYESVTSRAWIKVSQ